MEESIQWCLAYIKLSANDSFTMPPSQKIWEHVWKGKVSEPRSRSGSVILSSSASFQPFWLGLVWFGFSKCAKRLPCVGNFHKTSFHSIVITSKWQLCWGVKCFISLYFHVNRMKYGFVNLEVEKQVGSRRGKENWRWLSVSYRIQKGFSVFCYPVLQRVTLK